MAQDAKGLALAAEFPAVTEADWLAKVDQALKGAPLDKLVSKTYDGIDLKPLYTPADWDQNADQNGMPGASPFTRGGAWRDPLGPPWHVRARLTHPDPKAANKDALTDLVNGATALELVMTADPTQGGNEAGGVTVQTYADLATLLDSVMLDLAPVSLKAGADAAAAAMALMGLWEEKGVSADDAVASFNLDPLGTLAAAGTLPYSVESAYKQMRHITAHSLKAWPKARAVGVNAAVYHVAGASEAQELGAALATAVAYLRALEEGSADLNDAAGSFTFTFALDADVFLGIAKLRAARRLWARVLEVSGLDPKPMVIEAETAQRMITAYDPWVNMLRTTAASFAGAVGGADSIAVRAFDEAGGEASALGRRSARNTQIILAEESHLGRVHDAAGGAGLFEVLTDELCEKAWGVFQSIEAKGGMAAVLESGAFAADITRTAEARAVNVARRKEQITGLNEFPNILEKELTVTLIDHAALAAQAAAVRAAAPKMEGGPKGIDDAIAKLKSGVLLSDLTAALSPADPVSVTPLQARPVGEEFEVLRKRSDEIKAATGTRPQIFLANLGPVAKHTARATFAKNFFEAGGIEAVGTDGFDDMAALGDAFKASGASLAIICGSDDLYDALGADAAAVLKGAGASLIYLAGKGGENEAAFNDAGVTDYIFMGANLLDILSAAYDRLMEAQS